MDSLKEQIVEKLEHLPETALQQVLDFVALLEWRREELREDDDAQWLQSDLSHLGSYEPYDWQPGELNEGQPVKYFPGKGVVIVEE